MATATKPAPTDGPTTTLTVPAKPALTTAANVTTLLASAAVVGGPIAWVGIGAAAAAPAAIAAGRKLRRRSAARRAAAGGGIGIPLAGIGTSGRSRVGRSGRAAGRSAGSAGGGVGRVGAARTAGAGRRAAVPAGTGGGKGGGLLGRLRRPSTGGGTAGGRTSTGRTGTGSTRTGGSTPSSGGTARSRGLLRRAAAAAKRTAGAIRAGSTATTPRAATAAAKRHANRPTPTGRGRKRRALGAAGIAAGVVGMRNGYRKLRRWTKRRVLGQPDPQPEKKTAVTKAQPEARRTGDKVRRPDGTITTKDSGAEGDPTMAGNGNQHKAPQPVGPVYQAARRVHATAVEYTVKGTMELRTEAWEFPYTIGELAAAIRARVQHCTREAVDPAYAQALAQIASTVDAAAQAAANLGPAFDALHKREIDRILRPRANEDKWDTTANRP